METESVLVALASGQQLYLRRFCQNRMKPGKPVFMVHGLVEDGRIFYSAKGKGLAYYLAKAGYDVYVADLRGKGRSWPSAGPRYKDGMHEAITQDIPALLKAIVRKRGPVPQIWISHAWGGVITSSYYARFGEEICPVESMVYFGSRRVVQPGGLRKWLLLNVFWRRCLSAAVRISGYLPAKSLQVGTTNETARFYRDTLHWMYNSSWVDTEDNFDYSQAIGEQSMPPSLYFACDNDTAFGNPDDVRRFIKDLGEHNGRLILLSRQSGSQQDYGHIEMLAAHGAEGDHFPVMLDWLDDFGPSEQSVKDIAVNA